MGMILLIAFLVVLSRRGRIGAFGWDPTWRPGHRIAPTKSQPALTPTPTTRAEEILANRLADGELNSDEYLERLSLIQTN